MDRKTDALRERQQEISLNEGRVRQPDFQLRGIWLHLARGAWLIFLGAELIITIISLIVSPRYGLAICPFPTNCAITPSIARLLRASGISPETYMIYNFALGLFQTLVLLGVGGLIFRRRSKEPLGLATSFAFVMTGLSSIINSSLYPPAIVFGYIYALCVVPALGFFLLTFPDGRFMPRWSWLLAVLWLVQTILFELPGSFNILSWPLLLILAELVLTYGGTLGVLIFRYARVFSYAQRQQAKWLVFGLVGFAALIVLTSLAEALIPALVAPNSPFQLVSDIFPSFAFLIIPLSVGIAILRTRLWDIDVIIRRALLYTILTVSLALIYAGMVLGVGTLMRDWFGLGQQNPLVIVSSTLVLAALFQPLRYGLQKIIDRRFYRSKYVAATTLHNFSATLRSEIDLSQLSEHLVTIVQETMQPSFVSLWLRQPQESISSRDQQPQE